jgi:hypothetical protein
VSLHFDARCLLSTRLLSRELFFEKIAINMAPPFVRMSEIFSARAQSLMRVRGA